MPLVLVEGAVISCPHGGTSKLLGGSPSATVNGQGVLTSGKEAGIVFGGAPGPPPPGMVTPCTAVTPAGTPQPCVTAPTPPQRLARHLLVGEQPALLATAGGATASGAGPGKWQVTDPGQQILEAE
ncbi:hypothetical protein ACFV0O_38830 [Kitasatospora sp. NPDC059577]|uniref:hypothetical protein n=1 Tax=Kitasatospora sp. NPDC059577 TaxID=3346873 RepID=UPI00369F82B1